MSLQIKHFLWEYVGLWRSLVARLHGAQEVVGSNPASPTTQKRLSKHGVPFLFNGYQMEGGLSLEMEYPKDYFIVKAKENGVSVIGLTRGRDTRFHHSEKLDKGEVMLAQFTESTSAVKIRGKAEIMTPFGRINTEE